MGITACKRLGDVAQCFQLIPAQDARRTPQSHHISGAGGFYVEKAQMAQQELIESGGQMPCGFPVLNLAPHVDRVRFVLGDLFLTQIFHRNAVQGFGFRFGHCPAGGQRLVQVQT